MSLAITEHVTCASCGTASDTTVWTSVNAELNPELKVRLLDGSLFVFHCPVCGTETDLNQALLYHDMGRRTMIQLLGPDEPLPGMTALHGLLALSPNSVYTLRVVRRKEDLIEKVRLLDAGLDDRVVESFKYMLTERLADKGLVAERISYLRQSEDAPSKGVWRVTTPQGEQELETEFRQPYEQLRRALRGAIAEQNKGMEWREVDGGYFARLANSSQIDA